MPAEDTKEITMAVREGKKISLQDSSPHDRLDTYIAEDRLIRRKWTATQGGRERACLLAVLSPECRQAQSAAFCPTTVMPPWLANLTPWIDDTGSEEAWPAMVRRYAAVARRWHALTPEVWHRLDYAARAIAVREARLHTTDSGVIAACGRVIALCDRVVAGDEPSQEQWAEAAAAAWSAGWSAEAEAGARAAAWSAARAATWSAAAAAAARSAAAAARSAAAAAAAWAAGGAAAAWMADRMTAAILVAIETECDQAEVAS
jgi:hypothetical protein